jgi:hypothetical protein
MSRFNLLLDQAVLVKGSHLCVLLERKLANMHENQDYSELTHYRTKQRRLCPIHSCKGFKGKRTDFVCTILFNMTVHTSQGNGIYFEIIKALLLL